MKTDCSAMVKREFKAMFPTIKFSVVSPYYGKINVRWTDGPTTKQVEHITCKYEMGHFDGMVDSYDYSNRRDDIPQVKYLFCIREHSDLAIQTAIDELRAKFGFDGEANPAMYHNGQCWRVAMPGTMADENLQTMLHRYFSEK